VRRTFALLRGLAQQLFDLSIHTARFVAGSAPALVPELGINAQQNGLLFVTRHAKNSSAGCPLMGFGDESMVPRPRVECRVSLGLAAKDHEPV